VVKPGATGESAFPAGSEGGDEPPIMFHRVPEPKVRVRPHPQASPGIRRRATAEYVRAP
jgi:hypothetical protein